MPIPPGGSSTWSLSDDEWCLINACGDHLVFMARLARRVDLDHSLDGQCRSRVVDVRADKRRATRHALHLFLPARDTHRYRAGTRARRPSHARLYATRWRRRTAARCALRRHSPWRVSLHLFPTNCLPMLAPYRMPVRAVKMPLPTPTPATDAGAWHATRYITARG